MDSTHCHPIPPADSFPSASIVCPQALRSPLFGLPLPRVVGHIEVVACPPLKHVVIQRVAVMADGDFAGQCHDVIQQLNVLLRLAVDDEAGPGLGIVFDEGRRHQRGMAIWATHRNDVDVISIRSPVCEKSTLKIAVDMSAVCGVVPRRA